MTKGCPECCVDELRRVRTLNARGTGCGPPPGSPPSPAAAGRGGSVRRRVTVSPSSAQQPPSGGFLPGRRASCPDGAALGDGGPPGGGARPDQTPERTPAREHEHGEAATAQGPGLEERGAPTTQGRRRRKSLEPLADYIRRRRSSSANRTASLAQDEATLEQPQSSPLQDKRGADFDGARGSAVASREPVSRERGASTTPRARRSSLETVAESPVPERRRRSRSVHESRLEQVVNRRR